MAQAAGGAGMTAASLFWLAYLALAIAGTLHAFG